MTGRERIYLEHFWNDFAADPTRSVSEADRVIYAREYAQPGHMQAGMEVFRAFPKDAEDFAAFAKTKLKMPLLILFGEKAGRPFLIEQGKMVADNVRKCFGEGPWALADGGSARTGCSEPGRFPQQVGHFILPHEGLRVAPCDHLRISAIVLDPF